MNIEIANRLVDLRKKSGLSQEDLAAKLGLSRQAVSKWERAEASPDTDNLICLAKLYGVSLDTLLNTDESIDDIVKEQVKPEASEASNSSETKDEDPSFKKKDDSFTGDSFHIGSDGIHIHDKDGNDHDYGPNYKADFIYGNNSRKHHFELAQAIASSVVSLLCIVAYLCCGFLLKDAYLGWGICWLVFFLIPLTSSFIEALRYHSFTKFAFPVLVVGLYVLFGMLYKAWHPEWIIFLAIPLYYTIFKPIDKLIREHDFKKGKSSLNVRLGASEDKDDDDDVIDIDAK